MTEAFPMMFYQIKPLKHVMIWVSKTNQFENYNTM